MGSWDDSVSEESLAFVLGGVGQAESVTGMPNLCLGAEIWLLTLRGVVEGVATAAEFVQEVNADTLVTEAISPCEILVTLLERSGACVNFFS